LKIIVLGVSHPYAGITCRARRPPQHFLDKPSHPTEQMLEVLGAEPTLENTAADYAPRPDYRPVTKFENRGLRLGHGVWDLVFKKRG
jgi:tRNA G46 methylase TrmB